MTVATLAPSGTAATIGYIYGTLVTACGLFQLALGGSLALTVALYAVAMTALIPLFWSGFSVSSLIYILFSLYSGGFALIIKTLLVQPVQQNLIEPNWSALVLFAGHTSTTAAWVLATALPLRSRVASAAINEFNSINALRFFAAFSFASGLLLKVLHNIYRPQFIYGSVELSEGFGGFGVFGFLLVFGFAAQAALCAKTRAPKEYITAGVMFTLIAGLSIIANVKKELLDAGLIIALTVAAFNVRIKPSIAATAVAFLALMQFVVSPLIHITRAQSETFTIAERIELTQAILRQNNYDLGRINALNDEVFRSYEGNYRSTGSYVYPSTLNIDRFALILPIDQVVRTHEPGKISPEQAFDLTLQAILPSALIDKSAGILADYVAWYYGFRTYGVVGRPVTGLTASSWAIAGLPGVLIIGFVVPAIMFWILGAVGGPLGGSPWAVGLVTSLSVMQEATLDAVFGYLFRDLIVLLSTIALLLIARRFLRRGADNKHARRHPIQPKSGRK
jgi:hypothetical protein